MIPHVTQAVHVRDCTIRIVFSDGTGGEVDLAGELEGEVFRPLKDPAYFKRFVVHPELRTLTWPNGADFAPEFLYERVRVGA